jgi:hypothetical protein
LLTCYSPVRRWVFTGVATGWTPLDLHVLSTPPAFVLSQDQTLHRDRWPPGWATVDRRAGGRGLLNPALRLALRTHHSPTGPSEPGMARRVVVRSQCIDIAVTRVTARTGIWLSVPFSRSARGTRLRLRRWCALSGGLRSVPRTSSPAGSRRSRDLDCAAWLLPRRAAARCGATGNPTRRGGRSSRGKSRAMWRGPGRCRGG